MKRAVIISVVLVTVAHVTSSCMLSGMAYADRAVGYSVTKGNLVRVDNLATEEKHHLSDGVAIHVPDPGCSVVMRLGEPLQVIELIPGSILVLGEEADWVLQPYGVTGELGAPRQTVVPMPVPSEKPRKKIDHSNPPSE